MDFNKYTQKSMQAVQDSQKLAYEYGNQKIEQAHLLLALLQQDESLIDRLLARMKQMKTIRNATTSANSPKPLKSTCT